MSLSSRIKSRFSKCCWCIWCWWLFLLVAVNCSCVVDQVSSVIIAECMYEGVRLSHCGEANVYARRNACLICQYGNEELKKTSHLTASCTSMMCMCLKNVLLNTVEVEVVVRRHVISCLRSCL